MATTKKTQNLNPSELNAAVKAATEKGKPAAAPKPFLPNAVERIAASVANLLRYGGHPEDLVRIILATVSEETRGKSFRGAYRTDMEERIEEYQKRDLPRMLKELADFRIERPRFEDDPEVPAAIAERVRQTVREQCAREFRDFLQDADPEEVRFLYNVFVWYSSKGHHRHELSIATAFFDEIDSNIEMFRVPKEHSAAVGHYIQALMKAIPEDAAA